MPPKPTRAPIAAKLRQLAESRLRKRQMKQVVEPADTQRLLHELQVHQIELEMQNAELQDARDGTESLLEKYTDLYDFAPVGYFTLAKDGTIQMGNLAGATLVGMDRSKLAGQSFASLISVELRSAFHDFLRQVFAEPTKQEGEFKILSKGRSPRFIKVRAQRSLSGLECNAVIVDITERQEAEDRMRISEIRYRRLFEAAHDGVLLLDPSTRQITDANPFMTTMLGYPHDQLVGKELFEIGLLKDEAASQEMFQNLKSQHQVRYEDLPLESQDGRHQEVEVVANLYQESGHAVIQCNIRDITARKLTEDILKHTAVTMAALVAQVPVGVYVVDAKFRLQQVNPKARPVFENIHPYIGRDFAEIVHLLWPKKIAEPIIKHFLHTLKTGEPYHVTEMAGRRRDLRVKKIYEWSLQRIKLPGGEHSVVCFFEDITERREAELAQSRLAVVNALNHKMKREIVRRQVAATALESSRLTTYELLIKSRQLQDQLRNLSHRLLTAHEEERKRISRELHDVIAQALTGIHLQLASLHTHPAARSRDFSDMITKTERLVAQSVDVVHRFARDLRPTMLDDLGIIPTLRSFVQDFTQRTGLPVEVNADAGMEKLENAARTVLYRIAQEALTNVSRHAKATHAEINLQKCAGCICMEIKDNGHGFDTNDITKNNRLGMLGMRERAEMIGGTFSIASAPGHFTCVRVEIPTGKARIPSRTKPANL